MTTRSKDARIAGVLYTSTFIGAVRLLYIPNKLFVAGNAAISAANIARHETLFRFGIFADVLAGVALLFVTLALYRLFRDVDKGLAVLMVILGSLLVVPIYYLNTLNDVGMLLFARGEGSFAVFPKLQRDAFVQLFLDLHAQGNRVNEIFWGLWLIPMGVLTYRSRFLPRWIGIWLVLNSLPYLATACTGFFWPQYQGTVWDSLFPLSLGEVAMMLWLVIMGAKETSLVATA